MSHLRCKFYGIQERILLVLITGSAVGVINSGASASTTAIPALTPCGVDSY